jgi:hypothetical protein
VPEGSDWAEALVGVDPDELVVVGTAGRVAVVGDVAVEPGPHGVVVAPGGGAALGTAGALAAAARTGQDGDADADGAVFHRLSWHDGVSVVVAGVLVDAERGTRPAVAVGDPGDVARLAAELADPGGRDLGRLLRYDDAADPAFALREVGPDLLAGPFWTPPFCATVVRAAEAAGAFAADEEDPVPGHEVSLAALSPRLYAHLEDDLLVRFVPAARAWWPLLEYHGLRDAFVIKYSRFGQRELRDHHDVAQVSATIRLNDGHRGGALEFPRQGVTSASLAVGELLAWPSLVTHPHRTAPLAGGVKYGLTIWLELPPGSARV